MTGGVTALNRNSIVIKTPATATTPAIYDCDLDHNGTYGDGEDIACNYLKYDDLIAYLDWSALRPMTEMEYEKVCRGTGAVQSNEYPFGISLPSPITLTNSANISNSGLSNEISTIVGPGLSNFGGAPGTGPLRCGFAATSSTVRTTAGATIYGVMEMAGNVWEQCMQVGWGYYFVGSCSTITYYPATGILFTGVLGDGNVDVNGNADAANWGTSFATILKGGSWSTPNTVSGLQQLQISDRTQVFNTGTYPNNSRANNIGGRGVRKP